MCNKEWEPREDVKEIWQRGKESTRQRRRCGSPGTRQLKRVRDAHVSFGQMFWMGVCLPFLCRFPLLWVFFQMQCVIHCSRRCIIPYIHEPKTPTGFVARCFILQKVNYLSEQLICCETKTSTEAMKCIFFFVSIFYFLKGNWCPC